MTAFSQIAAREGSCPIWETSLQWETPFSDHHFLFKIKVTHPFSIKGSFYHGHFHKSCENCIENSMFAHCDDELLNLCLQVLVSGLGRKATLLSGIAHHVTCGCFPLTALCHHRCFELGGSVQRMGMSSSEAVCMHSGRDFV